MAGTNFASFPADDLPRHPDAWLTALDQLLPGDVVTVLTPDNAHQVDFFHWAAGHQARPTSVTAILEAGRCSLDIG